MVPVQLWDTWLFKDLWEVAPVTEVKVKVKLKEKANNSNKCKANNNTPNHNNSNTLKSNRCKTLALPTT